MEYVWWWKYVINDEINVKNVKENGLRIRKI